MGMNQNFRTNHLQPLSDVGVAAILLLRRRLAARCLVSQQLQGVFLEVLAWKKEEDIFSYIHVFG